ncbi:hypothetical protein BY996DRAFT_3793352 [Phakopsora pachyrhizi]|nr:hypothetical protein BY996DRAFT_3793352 [Phakopsora pachyrhizi]
MQALNRDWERLSTKSSTNHREVVQGVDQVISHLELLKDLLHRDGFQVMPNGLDPILTQSKTISKSALQAHKEYHSIYSKWQKAIDKKFNQTILPLLGAQSVSTSTSTTAEASSSKSKLQPFSSDTARLALKRVITSHLLRQGRFDTARIFAEESELSVSAPELQACQELHQITSLIQIGYLDEALSWAMKNREWLKARESTLEFDLRRSAFVRILTQADFDKNALDGEENEVTGNMQVEEEVTRTEKVEEEEEEEDKMMMESVTFENLGKERESLDPKVLDGSLLPSGTQGNSGLIQPNAQAAHKALEYARYHFPRFFPKKWDESVKLTASVLFTPLSKLRKSPYAEFFKPAPDGKSGDQPWLHAYHLVPLFTKEFNARMEWSKELPLKVATDLGSGGALAKIAKVRSVMKEKRTEWSQSDELPVEIPLPQDYRFHSVFACPVSKEQSTESNPPMMMPCGHVIAKESMQKLAKGGG